VLEFDLQAHPELLEIEAGGAPIDPDSRTDAAGLIVGEADALKVRDAITSADAPT
jgi:hypothetical protein